MIWTIRMIWALAFLAFALSTYAVYRAEMALRWVAQVVYLIGMVAVCAIDVAALMIWEALWGKSR